MTVHKSLHMAILGLFCHDNWPFTGHLYESKGQ